LASTYAQERRATVRVLVVRIQAFEVFYRATEEALGIYWVATLPVIPYLINHLSSSPVISVSSSLRNVSITYRMVQKEKRICKVHLNIGGETFECFADAPFGVHVGPGVQFDEALLGHDPIRSLDTSKVRKTEAQLMMT
jgi:hypothetical protein